MTVPYLVPWIVERDTPWAISLINNGDEVLTGVTFSLAGAGVMPVAAPVTVMKSGRVQVAVRGKDLPRSTLLIVRWLRPNGDDYLWRIAF